MTIPLRSGSTIIMNDDFTGKRIIMMMRGMSIGAGIIEANEELFGTDAWANREIELYQEALEIDLAAEKEFIKEYLRNAVASNNSNKTSNKTA